MVVDVFINMIYISGVGKESVIWVVDGEIIKLKMMIENIGKMSMGLVFDSKV